MKKTSGLKLVLSALTITAVTGCSMSEMTGLGSVEPVNTHDSYLDTIEFQDQTLTRITV